MCTKKSSYAKSKEQSSNIMDKVAKILSSKKIKFESNKNNTEIVVNSKSYDKNKLTKLIEDKISDDTTPLSLLIKITDVDNSVFIRQVSK